MHTRRSLAFAAMTLLAAHPAAAQTRHTVNVANSPFAASTWGTFTAIASASADRIHPGGGSTAIFRTRDAWGVNASLRDALICVERSTAFRGLTGGGLVGGRDDCVDSGDRRGVGELQLRARAGETLTLHDFMIGLRGSSSGISGVQIFDLGSGALLWSDRRSFSSSASAALLSPGISSRTGFILQWGLTESMVSWNDVTDGRLALNHLTFSSVVTAPEPGSLALLATGLGLTAVIVRRRRRA